jgi:hypothetical protein
LYMQLGGLVVALFAWFWLLGCAFRQDRRWGVASLVLPPVGLLFVTRHPRKGIAPLLLAISSLVIAATPAVYTVYI